MRNDEIGQENLGYAPVVHVNCSFRENSIIRGLGCQRFDSVGINWSRTSGMGFVGCGCGAVGSEFVDIPTGG